MFSDAEWKQLAEIEAHLGGTDPVLAKRLTAMAGRQWTAVVALAGGLIGLVLAIVLNVVLLGGASLVPALYGAFKLLPIPPIPPSPLS